MTDLAALVTLHRQLLADDRWIEKLATVQPPTTYNHRNQQPEVEPAGHMGMTLSGRLLRYVGNIDDDPGYGEVFPWTKAYQLTSNWCRRNHPHHRGPDNNWRGSLCRQAIRLVIDIGWSPEHAARVLKAPELDMVLETALAQVERFMDESRAKVEQRETQDRGVYEVYESAAPMEHRPLEGLHREECPQCRRRSAAA